MPEALRVERFEIPNHDGWMLHLRRTCRTPPAPSRRPLLIIPGYGMNSFIFSFHPSGRSLEAYLADEGFEVWSVDLRAQGGSKPVGEPSRYGLRELGLVDVPAAVSAVLERTQTNTGRVDLVGCSLGATLMFMYAGLHPEAPERMGSLVNLGGPLRWERAHPVVRLAFASPALAGAVPFRGTRALARALLPVLAKVPGLLDVYLNTRTTDISRAEEMIQTVEDPIPEVNRDIARWIKSRDLLVDGANLTHSMAGVRNPLLCVVALDDGIVPPETARSPLSHLGSLVREELAVGGRHGPYAHADLFLGRDAEARVFAPLGAWLLARYGE
ncbi:MAG: alpha/beta fold hydrolase [Deltaproteobacteria bacterium]|nr:alpha/beta fold hydrolase [Deltaproteobacteria bacterium]